MQVHDGRATREEIAELFDDLVVHGFVFTQVECLKSNVLLGDLFNEQTDVFDTQSSVRQVKRA